MNTYRYEDATGLYVLVFDVEGRQIDRICTVPGADQRFDALVSEGVVFESPEVPPVTEATVRSEGARRLARIASPYAPQERETWHVQVEEAKAFTADPSTPTPMLTPIATARGQTVADFAAHVLAKNDAFAAACGAVLAAQAAILALDPLPTDYAHDSRWPA